MHRFFSIVLMAVLCGLTFVTLSGCDRPVVHQKSVSELNQKAAQLMQKGDAAGAVSRLEAAHDLVPDDGMVQYNLGIAYQANHQPDKAIETLTSFVKTHPHDGQVRSAVQSLAVVYEQLADHQFAQSTQEEAEDGQKITPAQQAEFRKKGVDAMKQAIAHYQHLYTLGGLRDEDKTAIENHVKQLQDTLIEQSHQVAQASS